MGQVTSLWEVQPDRQAPAPGDSLTAFGRPSDFAITRSGGAQPAENGWTGTVEAARFFGTHVEYVVRIGEARLRSWLPAERGGGLPEGTDVDVSVAAADLLAVPES